MRVCVCVFWCPCTVFYAVIHYNVWLFSIFLLYGHTYSKSIKINRVRYQYCSWSAEQEKGIFSCPRSRLRVWSRDTDSAVPSRVSLLIPILRPNLVLNLRNSSRFPRRRPRLFKPTYAIGSVPSLWVTQLRIDGVHCQESAGTGPVNLKVVPNGCCLGRSPWTN